MTDEIPLIHDAQDARNAAISLVCAVLGVCIVFIVVLDWRFPYIHQLPVFDIDYITTIMMMFARNWWIEGPWHMVFSMPYAPLSVETPTPDLRYAMYASWPPGAVLPIYLIARLTNTEPNITMVNWLNVGCHGLIALFLSLSAYFTVHMLRRPRIEGVVLAIMVGCLVLFPRGPVYLFSQVYAFDTLIVVFYALLIFVATLEFDASDQLSARRYYYLQIVILVCGLFVDWLFYFVFAVWFVLRLAGTRTGYGRAVGRKEACSLAILPFAAFSIFLVWRFLTPGSIAARQGVLASIQELLWKLIFRIGNNPDDHPVSMATFLGPFYKSHQALYWDIAPLMIGAGFIFGLALFAALFAMSRGNARHRTIYFGLFSIFLLSIVPAYLQLTVFKQHTSIHPSSMAKVLVPLAMIPGVFVPILVLAILERWQDVWKLRWRRFWRVAGTVGVLAFAYWTGAEAWPSQRPYLLGRVNPAAAVPWLAIHDMTSYRDVVFSPDLQAAPFGIEAAVAGKLVYKAQSFPDVDRVVERVCGTFHVVVVRNGQDAEANFDGRKPNYVIRIGGLTLMRFEDYPGAAKGCR